MNRVKGSCLEILADELQDEAHLIGRALWKAARSNRSVLAFMKVVGMRRQMGMVGRVVEPEELAGLPPAFPMERVFAGGA